MPFFTRIGHEHKSETRLNLARRLRPIRLAFLVSPYDPKMLRRVVEANTCLWGGTQNPIIPIFRRRPNSWEDSWSWPGGRAYATGLLNGFEPDFVVETKQGLARNLGLPDRRIITLKDVLDPDRDPHVAYGISAADILRHAYDEELKFVRRRKLKAVWPPLQTAPTTLFEAVVLGRPDPIPWTG